MLKNILVMLICTLSVACKNDSELSGLTENRLYLDSASYDLNKEGEEPIAEELGDIDANEIELSSGFFSPSDFYKILLSDEQIKIEVNDQENCKAFIIFTLTPTGENNYSAVPSYEATGCTVGLGNFADEVDSILLRGASGIPVHIEKTSEYITLSLDEYEIDGLVGDIEALNGIIASGSVTLAYKNKSSLLTQFETSFTNLFGE